MKLKTLKDIEWETNWKDDVRKEAIKWVKNCNFITGFTLLCAETTFEHKCEGCKKLMKFHNITEEDLKEVKNET